MEINFDTYYPNTPEWQTAKMKAKAVEITARTSLTALGILILGGGIGLVVGAGVMFSRISSASQLNAVACLMIPTGLLLVAPLCIAPFYGAYKVQRQDPAWYYNSKGEQPDSDDGPSLPAENEWRLSRIWEAPANTK